MTVRKKREGTDLFEDVIKQEDQVIQFTIAAIDRQIARHNEQIAGSQAEIVKLEARKTAANAIV